MKNKVFFLLLALLAMSQALWAQTYDFSYTYQGKTLYYQITDDTSSHQARVVNPSDSSYSSYVSGAVEIPDSVENAGVRYAIIFIGQHAFYGCAGLTSVTIPNTVTIIGQHAFESCGLTSVTIPNSVVGIRDRAFRYCQWLTSVTIGNSVTSIGGSAFYECTRLTSVSIPNSVTSIGNYAFYDCIRLTSVTIGNSVTSIGGGAFTSCIRLTSVTIPNSVTSIGNSAFLGCSGLTSVTIPNSVTSIGLSAFSGCTGLTSVVFNADSCTSAGSSSSPVFRGCLNINSFVFGNNVKVIPAYLCNGMGGLTSITIPDSVTSIGDQAFSSCSGLTSVSVSNGNTIYDSRNGCNAIIHTSSNTLISGCRNTLIPNTVTSIGDYAFSGCTGLTSVTIPNSVTSIGTSAFYECSGLTEINSLASVAPQLGSNAFSNVTSTIPVNIPCGSSASYYSRWSYFSNFVEAAAPTFSVQSANTAMGTVSILTQPTCQAPTAVFQATANNGFQFSHWSDHNMDNPRSISLTQDTSFTAYFAPATHDTVIVHDTVTNTVHDTLVVTDTVTNTVHDTLVVTDTITIDRYDTIYLHDTIYIHDTLFMGSEGIGDVKTIDAKIYARDGQIVVEGAEGMPVVLYDAVGRQLTALREEAHGGTPLRFDVPASGVYIVKIGTLAAQKVVVIR